MVKAKGENPSPRYKPKYRVLLGILLKIITWSLTLINECSCRFRDNFRFPINTLHKSDSCVLNGFQMFKNLFRECNFALSNVLSSDKTLSNRVECFPDGTL